MTEPATPDQEQPTPRPTTDVVRRAEPTAVAALGTASILTDRQIDAAWRTASALARSGMFKDVSQAEVAFAKILLGRDLGISPTQALMTIDVVKGNVQLRGVLLASFIRRHPDYEYKVLENDQDHAKVRFLGFPAPEPWDEEMVRHRGRFWEVLGEETFTVADAQRAGLVKDQSGWKSHPKNMCLWRAISNGVKFHMPDLMGGIPVYTEADDFPDEQGFIDGAPVPDAGSAAAPEADVDAYVVERTPPAYVPATGEEEVTDADVVVPAEDRPMSDEDRQRIADAVGGTVVDAPPEDPSAEFAIQEAPTGIAVEKSTGIAVDQPDRAALAAELAEVKAAIQAAIVAGDDEKLADLSAEHDQLQEQIEASA